jgi:hypothetical protein
MRGWPSTVWRALALGAAVASSSAAGQPTATASPPTPGDELEIYVMTMGPGDQIWTRFGHNAIGIRDRRAGTDIVYNWGTFDFGQTHFLLRFIQGRMLYWVADADARLTESAYARENRTVEIQELSLTPAQRVAIRDYIAWNMREENRTYRYDYFRDNCSTRVRDVLDSALGGILRRQFEGAPSGLSFRDEARRLMEPDPLIYTGIDIGLGSPSDREMSRWDAMFIPMRLRDLLRDVKVTRVDGQSVPLVQSERTVVTARRAPELPVAPPRILRYLLIGSAVAALIVLAAVRAPRASGMAGVVPVAWGLVAGFVGVLLLVLWFLTDHIWAYRNANLLFFHPLWFAAIPALRRAGGGRGGTGRALVMVCGALAAAGLVVALVGVPQDTRRMASLAVPIIGAICWLVLGRRAPSAPVP